MSDPAHTSMKLSKVRMAQMKAIAAAHGLTLAALIERWIGQEIEAGTIPANLAGVTVELNTADRVSIALGDLRLDPTRPDAVEFSKRIRELAAGHKETLNASFAEVRRRGTGISVTSPFTGKKFVMSLSTADAVADQIDATLSQ